MSIFLILARKLAGYLNLDDSVMRVSHLKLLGFTIGCAVRYPGLSLAQALSTIVYTDLYASL
jgi:hypothetical protein